MQRDDVSTGQQGLQRNMFDSVAAILRRDLHIGVGDQQSAAEGLQQFHHSAADRAIADNADCHLAEFTAGAISAIEIASPLAGTQRFVAGADETRFGKNGSDRKLGDGARVAARRVDDQNPMIAGGLHVDIHRPPARNRDELQIGEPFEHRPRDRRQMGDEHRGVTDECRDLVRTTHEFLQLVERRIGVAMLHRLIGPWLLVRPDSHSVATCGCDPVSENRGQHEAIANDRNRVRHRRLPHARRRAASRAGAR